MSAGRTSLPGCMIVPTHSMTGKGVLNIFVIPYAQVVVGKQQEETENAFVGGRNRWTYDSFVNW